MNRRRLLVSLSSVCFLCPLCVNAATRFRGCNRAAAGGTETNPPMLFSSGDASIDAICREELEHLRKFFRVRATFGFFDDGTEENAIALSAVYDRTNPDGTVLIGINFAKNYLQAQAGAILVVMAHEWGHIEQYKKKEVATWGVKFELDADRRSGEYWKTRMPGDANGEMAAKVFFNLGDAEFADPDYHGHPSQRADMFRYGFGLETGIEKRGQSDWK
jgi:hypothetical protein